MQNLVGWVCKTVFSPCHLFLICTLRFTKLHDSLVNSMIPVLKFNIFELVRMERISSLRHPPGHRSAHLVLVPADIHIRCKYTF